MHCKNVKKPNTSPWGGKNFAGHKLLLFIPRQMNETLKSESHRRLVSWSDVIFCLFNLWLFEKKCPYNEKFFPKQWEVWGNLINFFPILECSALERFVTEATPSLKQKQQEKSCNPTAQALTVSLPNNLVTTAFIQSPWQNYFAFLQGSQPRYPVRILYYPIVCFDKGCCQSLLGTLLYLY